MLIVPRDATATAQNFLASPNLVHAAFAFSFAAVFFHVAWAATLHRVLRVVDEGFSKLALQMLHLLPPLARELNLVILVASALGEIPMMVWLLWKGVDDAAWRASQGHVMAAATPSLA